MSSEFGGSTTAPLLAPLKQNSDTADYSLKDAFSKLKREIMLSLQCHHIATIQEFDPLTQTAIATVNYTKTYMRANKKGAYVPQSVAYPVLIDCPVIFLGGVGSCLTFPVNPGDECIALFNDRSIDNWFSGALDANVAAQTLHSFSDALLLVGIRSLPNVIEDFNTTDVILRNGITGIAFGPEKIRLGNGTQDLKSILDDLIQALDVLLTGLNPGTLAAQAATAKTALAGVSLEISGLLEGGSV